MKLHQFTVIVVLCVGSACYFCQIALDRYRAEIQAAQIRQEIDQDQKVVDARNASERVKNEIAGLVVLKQQMAEENK